MKKINLSNIKSWSQGNIRYKLFYNSKLSWLIRNHIREQIEFRIMIMNLECYNQGSCLVCGCRTTHLQMANKSCSFCYPPMLNKLLWEQFKAGDKVWINTNEYWHMVGELKQDKISSIKIYHNNTLVNTWNPKNT